MNHVFSYAASLPQSLCSAFTEQLLPELTAQQKKVLIVSSIAFSILAACFLAYRHCFSQIGGANSPAVIPLNANGKTHSSPVSSPVKQGTKYQQKSPYQPPHQPLHQPLLQQSPKNNQLSPNHTTNSTPTSPRTAALIAKLMSQSPKSPLQGQTQDQVVDSTIPSLHSPKVDSISKPKAPRTGLQGEEDYINDLMQDLKTEQEVLSLLTSMSPLKQSSQGQTAVIKKDEVELIDVEDLIDLVDENPIEKNDFVDTTQKKIAQMEGDLKVALKSYPTTLRQYLEDKFNGSTRKDFQDIFYHLVRFSGIMDLNVDNPAFIQDCLTQVDAFLTHAFFTSPDEMYLPEEKKMDLIVFNPFFSIVEEHFQSIANTNPQLAFNLKVKLANLPLREETDRSTAFPNIYLTEKDQLDLLINHFQNEEERLTNLLMQNFSSKKFNNNDIHKLSRIISKSKSCLTDANKLKLQNVLAKQMGKKALTDWNDPNKIEKELTAFFNPSTSTSYGYGFGYGFGMGTQNEILELYRASKAKEYFEEQIGLKEEEIQIPRWYHATKFEYLKPIIDSGKILVMHKQAYSGAWVSNQREPSMGDCVFIFNHKITKIDPNVFIGFEKGKVNWRGLQKEIPLAGPNKVTNMHLMGYRKYPNQKTEKQKIIQDLPKSFKHVTVVSVDQIDYLQKQVVKVIGNPNLTEKWWGKADINLLDKEVANNM